MFYLVTKKDLEDLLDLKIGISELTRDNNRALMSWSGEDIDMMLVEAGEKKIKLKDILEYVINDVDHLDCRECIKLIFEEALNHLKEEK